MSYSGGTDNKTILELLTYYNQLHDWKSKVKRRFTKSPPKETHTKNKEEDESTPAPKPIASPRKQPVRDRSIKRRFRKYATTNGVASHNKQHSGTSVTQNAVGITHNSVGNKPNHHINNNNNDTVRSRRCKSMIELGDGSVANISFYDRGKAGDSTNVQSSGQGKQRKPVGRSVSMKERILDTAGSFHLN